MIPDILNDLDLSELLQLYREIQSVLIDKRYATGYKDGFNDGVKAERDRNLLKPDKEQTND